MLTRSRLRLAEARVRLEQHDGLVPLRDWLLQLAEREIHLVEWTWRTAQRPGLRRTAVLVSWLGNGLAYLLLGAIVLATLDNAAWPLCVAALSMFAAHLIYPWTKLACGRLRPCDLRAELEPSLASLDRHSFPSGHAMTLTAALVPILAAYPGTWPAALAAWLLMAWSRVACAHHYPSDVVAGGVLGSAVALPLTLMLS